MAALPRDAYNLLLKDFSDKIDEKGADSMNITEMVSKTIFFYETDVIKDNKRKEANNLINTKEIKKLKSLNAAQQKWRAKGGNFAKKGGDCTYCGNKGHTQDICFANPKSSSYRPKGGSKHRSVNKIQLEKNAANAARGDCTFCGKNGHTADTCRAKLHCNRCSKKGHLEATCTANPCSTCNKFYYRSANHKYHKCDSSAAETKGALNNICQQIDSDTEMHTERNNNFVDWNQTRDPSDDCGGNNHFLHSSGLHIDMSDDSSSSNKHKRGRGHRLSLWRR